MGRIILLLLLHQLLTGCGGDSSRNSDENSPTVTLSTQTTWQWQLSNTLNLSYDVSLYDIDLFDSTPSIIRTLHDKGKIVICYFSAGSYENWRSDAGEFPDTVQGESLEGWEGEQWLDIRSDRVRTIMQKRLDLAQQKGCDGVEPDNVDGYINDTGFSLTDEDQKAYNLFLAQEAHKRGLLIGLKNDLEQVEELYRFFDFAVNEQCHEYNECDMLLPFTEAGKPVFNAEYADRYVTNKNGSRDELCHHSKEKNLRTLILPIYLDDTFRYSCD
jgi:hypothetical protein